LIRYVMIGSQWVMPSFCWIRKFQFYYITMFAYAFCLFAVLTAVLQLQPTCFWFYFYNTWILILDRSFTIFPDFGLVLLLRGICFILFLYSRFHVDKMSSAHVYLRLRAVSTFTIQYNAKPICIALISPSKKMEILFVCTIFSWKDP